MVGGVYSISNTIPNLWVVIPTVHGVEHTRRLVRQLRSGEAEPAWIVVVDNHPGAGTCLMDVSDDCCTVMYSPEYLGAAKAFRLGIESAVAGGADVVWLLDDDAILEGYTLSRISGHLRRSIRSIIAANTDGTYAGCSVIGRTFRPIRKIREGEVPQFVPWSGMLISQPAQILPGFDAVLQYWWSWDDYALCQWASSSGYRISVASDAIISQMPKTAKWPPWKVYYDSRNGLLFGLAILRGMQLVRYILAYILQSFLKGMRHGSPRYRANGFVDAIRGKHGHQLDPSYSRLPRSGLHHPHHTGGATTH